MERKPIRQRPHRLPLEDYCGEVTVAFTLCVSKNHPLFLENNVVDIFIEILRNVVANQDCRVIIYCFMPDHLHIILQGLSPNANVWKAAVDFKQYSGYWLRRNQNQFHWQKGFFDHVIRKSEDFNAQIRYIAENPVRKGIVQHWDEYPYTGSVGIDLHEVINSLVEM